MTTRNLLKLFFMTLVCTGYQLRAQDWVPLGPDDNNWPCDQDFGNDGFVLDPLGNPVIAYRGAYLDYGITVRRWSGSHWYTVGPIGFANSSNGPCLATDAQGGFFVAYQDPDNGYRISVQQWSGGAWQLVGPPGFTAGQASPSGIEVDAFDRPVVAFIDNTQGYRVSVWRWNGMNWESIGSPGFSAGDVGYLDLAVDSSGDPVVAYRDNVNGKRTTVQRWNGSVWGLVGIAGFSPDSANYQQVALDADGNPVVVYQEIGLTSYNHTTVQRWDGASWVVVGPRGFSEDWARSQSIAIGPSGELVVAYLDDSFDGYHVSVVRWSGSDWQQYGGEGPRGLFSLGLAIGPTGTPMVAYSNLSYGGRTTVQNWNGGSWVVLGELGFSVEGATTEANKVSLALDPSGKPVVAYSDAAHYNKLTVRRWNGASWQCIGEPGFAQGGGSSCLAIDHSGRPVVAHQDGPYSKASVRRWNGTTWELIGPAEFSVMQAYYIDLTLDADGDPVVAYQDRANGYKTTVQRWNGSSWEVIGPSGFTTEAAYKQALVLDDSGNPIVAHYYSAQTRVVVHRWDGSAWQVLSAAGIDTWNYTSTSLVLDGTGAPVLAYSSPSGEHDVTVRRWNGSIWELLGSGSFGSEYPNNLCLTVDTTGSPLLAYDDGKVTVQRWSGTSWELVGSPRFTSAITSELKHWLQVDSEGRVIVAFVSGGAYAKAYPVGYPVVDHAIVSIGDVLNLGPNPNTGEVLWISLGGLSATTESVAAELQDMSGRCISVQSLPVASGELNSRFALPVGLASGMYVASVSVDGSRWSARLVVAKP